MPMLRERLATRIGPSSAAGMLLCVAALIFGGSRDFGVFLLSLVSLPILIVMALIATAVDVATSRRSAAGAGVALLVTAPLVFLGSAALRDQVRFVGWIVTHPSTAIHAGPTRVVATWDGWGMAGMENGSYLVVDERHDLGTTVGNVRWLRRVGQTCPLVDVKQVWRSLYIVTTYNCPFNGFPF